MEVKYCKDCKYFKKAGPHWSILFIPVIGWLLYFIFQSDNYPYKFAKCHRPKSDLQDLVGGFSYQSPKFCDLERKYDCGQHAQYFEPKKLRAEHLGDKEITDEIRRRGLYKLMKDYKTNI